MPKRGADKQLTQLDPEACDDDDEGEGEGEDAGNDAKADASVLAGRKVRKYKRPTASAHAADHPAGANPFASIQLKPSALGAGAGAPSPFAPIFGGLAAPAAPTAPPTFSFGAAPMGGAPSPFVATPSPFGGPFGAAAAAPPQPAAATPFGGALAAPAGAQPADARLKAVLAGVGPLEPADHEAVCKALNAELVAFTRAEWARCPGGDWSACVKEYKRFREQLEARKPAAPVPGGAGAPSFTFGGASPFGGSAPAAQPAAPKPAPVAAPQPVAPAPAGSSSCLLQLRAKLNVLRAAEGGAHEWREVGVGVVRLLADGGTRFVEFRPELSDQKAADDADPQADAEGTARLGRPVLSARLPALTKPEAAGKRLQVSLLNSMNNAEGKPARYSFLLKTPADAVQLAERLA